MHESGFTRQERHLIILLRVWMVAFFAVGCLFAAAPVGTVRYIERIGRGVFGWTDTPLALSDERFWLVLAVSLMGTLAYLAYKAQANLLRHSGYVGVILIATFISTAGYTAIFILQGRPFVYLMGAAVDGFIFIVTAVMYRSALKSRPTI